jgi:CheY-like chemotaxis protein
MKRPKRAVLVVDDDLDIREALTDILEDGGFSVLNAANGREALTLLRSLDVPPAVILLDLMMPILDGYGFLEEHRKDASLAVIPVAIITAGNGVDRSRIDEVTPIVPKPINVPRLFGILDDLSTSLGSVR